MQLNRTNDFVRPAAAEEPAPQAFTAFLCHLKSSENTPYVWNVAWSPYAPSPLHADVPSV